LIGFMGLMKVLLVLLVRVLVQWAGFDFVMVVWRVIRFIVGFNRGGDVIWLGWLVSDIKDLLVKLGDFM
jgi:hypothetical protein